MAQPTIDVAVTPAWGGWSSAGRDTEMDIRVRGSAAMQTTLSVLAGTHTVRTELALEQGRTARLHVPVRSAETVTLTAIAQDAASVRREVSIAQSESPLLAVGVALDRPVHLEGFHTVRVNPDDLPRNGSAYSSIAALILDASTLGALDQPQLAALLAHVGQCGRTVLVNADPAPRRVLANAAGCRGDFLMHATSIPDATEKLKASLATPAAAPIPLAGVSELARSDRSTWNRVVALVAAYFSIAAVLLTLSSSIAAFVLLPVLATAIMWSALNALDPRPELLVWSEAESGAHVARYEAWQHFSASKRGSAHIAVLPQLGTARPCDAAPAMLVDFDGARGVARAAEFDARLFQRLSLCYSGTFPITRAIAIEGSSEGAIEIRNVGARAWPAGLLLSRGHVHELPTLGPGEKTTVATNAAGPPFDAAVRTALSRTSTLTQAALWKLDLGSVLGGSTIKPNGWLLVSTATP
jgi:hypothetical protein